MLLSLGTGVRVSRRCIPKTFCIGYSLLQAPSPSPFLLPGVWDAADDGAEHEGCDEGEEGQVDEALNAVVTEACQGLHVVLRPDGTGTARPTETGRETGKAG